MLKNKQPHNQKIKQTVSIIGILLALSGMVNHGIFEILQGNTPTNGMLIEAIGTQHRFWIHGTETAFTIIPNYLLTGIAVVITSFLAMIWSARFLQTKHGVTIFFLLFALLALFGGGIGFLFIFLPTLAYATNMDKSLVWWRRVLPRKLGTVLAKAWPYLIVLTVGMWLMIMELGIFGYFPGLNNPDHILNVVMLLLLGTVICTNITFLSAISLDLES